MAGWVALIVVTSLAPCLSGDTSNSHILLRETSNVTHATWHLVGKIIFSSTYGLILGLSTEQRAIYVAAIKSWSTLGCWSFIYWYKATAIRSGKGGFSGRNRAWTLYSYLPIAAWFLLYSPLVSTFGNTEAGRFEVFFLIQNALPSSQPLLG